MVDNILRDEILSIAAKEDFIAWEMKFEQFNHMVELFLEQSCSQTICEFLLL
jgi:hypothetical protein